MSAMRFSIVSQRASNICRMAGAETSSADALEADPATAAQMAIRLQRIVARNLEVALRRIISLFCPFHGSPPRTIYD
jgi:hypothetical protein